MWIFMISCYLLTGCSLLLFILTGIQGYFQFPVFGLNHPALALLTASIYLFTEKIYKALEETQPGKGNEIQLTDGIQKQIELGQKIMAVKLKKALHLDIGTPESYWQALRISYERLANNRLNS